MEVATIEVVKANWLINVMIDFVGTHLDSEDPVDWTFLAHVEDTIEPCFLKSYLFTAQAARDAGSWGSLVSQLREMRNLYLVAATACIGQGIMECCGKTFSTKSNLNRHRKKHQDPQLFCSSCPKRFHRPDDLVRHQNSHRRNQPDVPQDQNVPTELGPREADQHPIDQYLVEVPRLPTTTPQRPTPLTPTRLNINEIFQSLQTSEKRQRLDREVEDSLDSLDAFLAENMDISDVQEPGPSNRTPTKFKENENPRKRKLVTNKILPKRLELSKQAMNHKKIAANRSRFEKAFPANSRKRGLHRSQSRSPPPKQVRQRPSSTEGRIYVDPTRHRVVTPVNKKTCPRCSKSFSTEYNKNAHVRAVHQKLKPFRCKDCSSTFPTKNHLSRHMKRHNRKAAVPKLRIQFNPKVRNKNAEHEHQESEKRKRLRFVTDPLLAPKEMPDVDEAIGSVKKSYWHHIRSHFKRNQKEQNFYNFHLNGLDNDDLKQKLWQVFEDQKTKIKLDVTFGYIMRNKIYRNLLIYYYASHNTSFLGQPKVVENADDFRKLLEGFENVDIMEYARMQRANSSFFVEEITNMTVYVTKLNGHPIGAQVELPAYIRNSHCIIGLDRDYQTSEPFNDNLCFFRCMALHKLGLTRREERRTMGDDLRYNLNAKTTELFEQFCAAADIEPNRETFRGIDLADLNECERLFEVKVHVSAKTEAAVEVDFDDAEGEVGEAMVRYLEDQNLAHEDIDVLGEEDDGRGSAGGSDDEYAFYDDLSNASSSPRPPPRRITDSEDDEPSDTVSPLPRRRHHMRFDSESDIEEEVREVELERIEVEEVEVEERPEEMLPEVQPDGFQEENVQPPELSAILIRRSRAEYAEVMYINHYEGHFSYITNIRRYTRSWKCQNCDRLFPHHGHFLRHESNCDGVTKYKYPGNGFGLSKTIFQELYEAIDYEPTNEADKFFSHYVTYDFEALLKERENPGDGKLKVVRDLEPASFGVYTNVPGEYRDGSSFQDPLVVISNGSPEDLIEKFFDCLFQISEKSYEIYREKHNVAIEELQRRAEAYKQAERDKKRLNRQIRENEAIPELGIELARAEENAAQLKKFDRLHYRFESWLNNLKVIGFNSGKFDLNLAKKYMIPYLVNNNNLPRHVIKRNNNYMSIAIKGLTFLDISNYLAAGTSYAKFLKAFGSTESKSVWPYEWFTSLEKLNEPQLPPLEAFWSELKQQNITRETYDELQQLWVDRGFQTMRDLLIYYNSIDVVPFLDSVKVMADHWRSQDVDMFVEAISLPGLAEKHMFKNLPKHTIFTLWNEANKDLYWTLKNNIVGGPSIIFKRRAKKDLPIREATGGSVPTKRILGYDANSLYLDCTAKPMPTSIYGVWRPINPEAAAEVPVQGLPYEVNEAGVREYKQVEWEAAIETNRQMEFHRTPGYTQCKKELEWIEWMSSVEQFNCKIQHRFNGGQKLFVKNKTTRYYVDGFIPERKLILQFHGCRFHGHNVKREEDLAPRIIQLREQFPENPPQVEGEIADLPLEHHLQRLEDENPPCRFDNEPDREKARQDWQRTQECKQFLEGQGYEVLEMWECEWENIRHTQALKDFREQHLDLQIKTTTLTAEGLLQRVQSNEFFGLVECTVEIPPWQTDLRNKFKDFPPVFKHAEIGIEHIGEHMQNFANRKGLLKKPRKALVSSYFGEKILLASPILKWYLDHGMTVSRVYQMIEFKAKDCFNDLSKEVADARRAADNDPSLKPKGEMWKTTGNSYYGKMVTALEKHIDLHFLNATGLGFMVNDPRFRRLTKITDDAFEVEMAKKKIVFKLPIIIGFFVYCYAKLRLLEFYFDFIDKWIDRAYYEPIECDTDSMYFALGENSLDEYIRLHKPYAWDDWLEEKTAFLAPENPQSQAERDLIREPGLFKLEWSGYAMVALNSKTYIGCEENEADENGEVALRVTKISHKGLSKVTNQMTFDDFDSVLRTEETTGGKNYGFMVRDSNIIMYEQERDGLSYLYIKRKVLDDGISTEPLDI